MNGETKNENDAVGQPSAEVRKELSSVAEAKQVLAELRAANAEKAALLEREERLHAERLLSGQASAGQSPPVAKEETPVEYKNRVMRGEL